MRDADLRAAYRDLLARRERGAGACPEPEALMDVVGRNGPEARRLATLDHVMGCPACAEDLEMLRAVAGSPPARAPSRPRIMALAASLVLLAGAGLGSWALLGGRGGAPAYRAAEGPLRLLAPAPGAPGRPPTLVWSSVPGAVTYRVEVFDAAGVALWAASTPDTVATLPDDVSLDPSTPLRWWVQARLRDGSEIASPPASFGGPGG